MSITIEQIDQIMDRTKVSYKEAKEMLEKHGGDVLEAIIEIENKNEAPVEKEHAIKKETVNEWKGKFKWALKQFGKLIQKSLLIKIVWKKQDQFLFELPLLVVLIITFWMMPFSLIAIVLPFFFGIKMMFKRESGHETDIASWIKKKTE
ncbi:MAG: hypothetical protein IBX70_00745 [Clostridia bacterium]|nr:hypothetical protein [Clostridia bacterium]